VDETSICQQRCIFHSFILSQFKFNFNSSVFEFVIKVKNSEFVFFKALEAMEMWEKLTSNCRSPIPFNVQSHEFLSLINPLPSTSPEKSLPEGRKYVTSFFIGY
jgi:hypothetical protein